MASALRILLVSRRFWPLVGDSEDAMADLAVGLRRYGAEPTVLTAGWSSQWPGTTSFQGTLVHRLPLRLALPWGRWAYLLGLSRWLRRHRQQFDLVVVARLRREACTTLRALRRSPVPVVLRAEADDCLWHDQSLLGVRCRDRCQRAAAIVYRDATTRASLLGAGYDDMLLHGIPDSVAVPPPRRGGSSLDARLALAAVNQDLNSAIDAPIAVFVGRLRPHAGLARLVRAWEQVVRHWPTAKLWLIGDGPYRDDLYRLIRDLDLRHCVQMPGTFESTDDLLRAANLLVHPGPLTGIPRVLLAAAAGGVPILVRSGPEIEIEIRQQPALAPLITLLDRDDAAAWGETLIASLRPPADRNALAALGRAVLRGRSMPRLIQHHLELFQSLVAAQA
ncbi:MAG: glycosyltransferase family 4 protein [Pirellulaceae bacterium]|nr:glycosyltransferase family 4 protein [Pirellulaceae bacterium]